MMKKSNSLAERFIWVIYAVLAGGSFLVAVSAAAGRGFAVKAAAILLFAAAWLVVYLTGKAAAGLCRHSAKSEENQSGVGRKVLAVLAESVLLLLCIIGMLMLRMPQASAVTTNSYYDVAVVSAGQELPFLSHGGENLYLWLLHSVLFLIGNRALAGAFLQIALQAVAAVGIFFAVRRLSGSVSALTALAFWCFSPYLCEESMQLSPLVLLLAIQSFAVWFAAGLWRRWNTEHEKGHPVTSLIRYLITGALIGVCCYLDLSGITAAVIMVWVILFDRDPSAVSEHGSEHEKGSVGFWNGKALVLICCTVFGALGFLGAQATAGALSGTGFSRAFHFWAQSYAPGAWQLPSVTGAAAWDIALLAFLLVVGIFSYYSGCLHKSRGVWFAAALTLLVLQRLGFVAEKPFNSFALLYVFAAAMAGCALRDIIRRGVKKAAEKPEEAPKEEEPAKEEEAPKEEPAREEPPKEEVRYIENPLPLPKKHEKKTMDFDHPVDENDDFDIP